MDDFPIEAHDTTLITRPSVGPEHVEELLDMLEGGHFTGLNVESNAKAVPDLIHTITAGASLRTLRLVRMEITEKIATAAVGALRAATHVEQLNLHDVRFASGVESLFGLALAGVPSLNRVFVFDASLGVMTLIRFLRGVATSPTVQHVALNYPGLDGESVRAISTEVEHASRLRAMRFYTREGGVPVAHIAWKVPMTAEQRAEWRRTGPRTPFGRYMQRRYEERKAQRRKEAVAAVKKLRAERAQREKMWQNERIAMERRHQAGLERLRSQLQDDPLDGHFAE